MVKFALRTITYLTIALCILTFSMWLLGRALRANAPELAYLSGDPAREIYLMDVERGLSLHLFSGSTIRDLAWSPDGTQLIFSMQTPQGHNLHILDAQTRAVRRFTEGSYHYNALWSPDGSRIAYLLVQDTAQIMLTDINGQTTQPIPVSDILVVRLHGWVDDQTLLVTAIQNNRVMAFTLQVATGAYQLPNADATLLAMGARSPDWQQVVFVMTSERGFGQELYRANIDGTARQRLTFAQGADVAPNWSLDGRYLAFTSSRSGQPEIYIMDAEGGQQRRLTYSPSSAWKWQPVWRP